MFMIQSSFFGINFDANASYGLLCEVSHSISQYSSILNPSSIHRGGQESRAQIEESRSEISQLLNLKRGDRVIFTSGATESNNTAILSKFHSTHANSNIVISNVEHPSVREAAFKLSEKGVEIREIKPNENQTFSPENFVEACDENTRVVSVMLANNETGQILPVNSIFNLVKSKYPHILCHSDCVQAVGKYEVDFQKINADVLSVSGHKIGALPGVGALAVRNGININPLLVGGPQEVRFRAGTENVLGIISFGIAAKVIKDNLDYRIARMKALKDSFRQKLSSAFHHNEAIIQFDEIETLPNTLSVRVPGIPTDDLLVRLDLHGLYVSAGAACASGKPEPSHVLIGMGLSPTEARETIRISLRAETSYETLCNGVEILVESIRSARNALLKDSSATTLGVCAA